VAGSTDNVIPDTAYLQGTIRTLSPERRADVVASVRRVATHVAAAHDMEIDFVHQQGYPVTDNDPAVADRVLAVAGELVGPERSVVAAEPLMGAEDFAYVLQRVPGAMAFLGACPPGAEPETAAGNHSNLVVFDEDVLPAGAALYAAMALDTLGG
jgi:metal-dependent amidase/aminoacylase/carboxypeptidase family protein